MLLHTKLHITLNLFERNVNIEEQKFYTFWFVKFKPNFSMLNLLSEFIVL